MSEKKPIKNPTSDLDSQAFLKLFIETLKNQTIDSTTDIKEIMQYTASMTTVETNNQNKEALEQVVTTLRTNSEYSTQYGLLPAIGKLAVTNQSDLQFNGKDTLNYAMFLPQKVKNGSIEIKNPIGTVVRTMSLDKYINNYGHEGKDETGREIKGNDGLFRFSWNGISDRGAFVEKGRYSVQIKYNDERGVEREAKLGEYEVKSVRFKEGKPYLNVGDSDVAFEDVKELRNLNSK